MPLIHWFGVLILASFLTPIFTSASELSAPPQFHGKFRLSRRGSDGNCPPAGSFANGTNFADRPVLSFGNADGIVLMDDVDDSDDLCRGRLSTKISANGDQVSIVQVTTYSRCRDKTRDGTALTTTWSITPGTFVIKRAVLENGERTTNTCRFERTP